MSAAGAGRHDHPHGAPGGAADPGSAGAVRRSARPGSARRSSTAPRANSSPRNSPSATRASRARAARAISSSRTSRKARAACAISTRSSGSRNTSIASTRAPDLVKRGPVHAARNRTVRPLRGIPLARALPPAFPRRPRPGAARLRAATGHRGETRLQARISGLSAVERFMKHYFLIAKDVGDLSTIVCAALEARAAKPPAMLDRFVRRMRRRRDPEIEGFRHRARTHHDRAGGCVRDAIPSISSGSIACPRSTASRSIPTRRIW